MKKKLVVLVISISIITVGCGKTQGNSVPVNKSTSISNGTTTDQAATTGTSSTSTTSAGKSSTSSISTSIDYSKYSGQWVKETNLIDDYIYGLGLTVKVDKNGELKGSISDCSENATHISNIDVSGKIQNNKFSFNFDNDGWDHSGTISLDFKDNNVILTIKYNAKSSSDNLWGIGEGSFTLINSNTKVNRTLDSLKDGGLQVIESQCFPIKLENYGDVKLISGSKRENVNTILVFYLVDNKNNVLYKFPDFYGNQKGMFNELLAVSFTDVNKDNLKDVVIVSNYQIGSVTEKISSLYLQKGKTFVNDSVFDKKMNESSNNKDAATVIKYAKDNLK